MTSVQPLAQPQLQPETGTIVAWRGGKPRAVLAIGTGPGVAAVPYESGATQSPRMRRWMAPGAGPNRALNYQLQTLRNRARQGERNNPWLWKAIDSLVSNEVGIGVTLRSAHLDAAYRLAATELWRRVQDELDPSRQLNFGGIQEQAVRGRRTAGQVFIRRLWRSLNAPLAVPFQLQVLEAEHCPEHYDTRLPNGNIVRAGKEFDRFGLNVAYWFYPDHPHDYRLGVSTDIGRLVRVPATDVIQHYSPLRPGQDHGEPTLVRSLLAADTLDKYLDAELRRKETRAPYTGAIERDWGDQDIDTNPATGAPLAADGAASVEPGTMLELNMGEKVHLFDADAGVQGIWDYARGVLLQVAAGAGGVPYELVTGDWQHVNDRLVRAMLNEFHRSIEAAQDHLLIFQVCARVWSWYIDAAVLAGKLQAPGYAEDKSPWRAVTCRPHGWPFVHGLQDAQTKASLIASGLSSRQEERDKMPGIPIEDVDRQRAEDQEREAELGLPSANPGDAQADPNNPDGADGPPTRAAAREKGRLPQAQGRDINLTTNLHLPAGFGAPAPINVTNNLPEQGAPVVNVTTHVPEQQAPVVHLTAQMPEQAAPMVNITNRVPEQAPPVVNVPAAVVHVAAPNVTVENQAPPLEVTVTLPNRKTETTVKRDKAGNITRATQIETDLEDSAP